MDPGSFQRFDSKPLRCHACMVGSQARHKFHEDKGDPHGVYFPVYDREAVNG